MNDVESPSGPDYAAACRSLSRRDPVMRALIRRVGACTLKPGGDPFALLVRAVVAQLISTAAAATIYGRIEATLRDTGVSAASVLALEEAALKAHGLSSAKTRTIRDMATRIGDGRLTPDAFATMSDDAIRAQLVAIPGIGPWTVDMYLIFGLGRPDVLPVGDFGLRAGAKDLYALEELPGVAELRELAKKWRPWASVATWYVWRSRSEVPQS